MKKRRHVGVMRYSWLGVPIALALLSTTARAQQKADESSPQGAQAERSIMPEEARAIAEDVYVYGYPLVTLEMTRRVVTNVAAPDGLHAPMGQFANAREYPTAAFRAVTAPNADTLYSSAFLNLSREPYILSLPDEHGRYYLMPMLSGWTDVLQVPGKRTTGTKPQTYAITGPGWTGTLPKGVTEYKSPTGMVWIPAAPTAPVRLRPRRQCTRSRTSTSSFRSVPMASRTRRRRARSIPASI